MSDHTQRDWQTEGMAETMVIGHLHHRDTSIVVTTDGAMPRIAYLGKFLGAAELDPSHFSRGVLGGGLDTEIHATLLPQASSGWMGRPGVQAHRTDGADIAFSFLMHRSHRSDERIAMELVDEDNAVELYIDVHLTTSGVVEMFARLTNTGSAPINLTAMRLSFPVGYQASEVLTLGGRHGMEAIPQRTSWNRSVISVENRTGRTSHENVGLIAAGTEAFTEHIGEVWGTHIAWSGNFELTCDAVSHSLRTVQAGELISPGEIILEKDQSYTTPLIDVAYSCHGLLNMSRTFHRHLRALHSEPIHRPVILNTWEAVYFQHDLETLSDLARAAADVGIERFVLDDGWFQGRRNDTAGLGDWWVDTAVWPQGLTPLIQHVRSLNMDFGLWFEPEMVNPDSDLYRQHPDWALNGTSDTPLLGRNQLVLDMSKKEVRDYLFHHLDLMLSTHDIAYVKWDHNRPLVGGRSAAHTAGTYELLQRLTSAHPHVHFESCASGGGRIDFGIAQYVRRFWASDSIDALDRLQIQRGLSTFMPLETLGSHIGSPTCHMTGRKHALSFRAATAMFGWMGVEWNLLSLTDKERSQLAHVVSVYKRFRPLLHSGDVFRADQIDTSLHIHGVIAPHRSEALISVSKIKSNPNYHSAPLTITDLNAESMYSLEVIPLGTPRWSLHRELPGWVTTGAVLSGQQLTTVGIPLPPLLPESSVLIHVKEVVA